MPGYDEAIAQSMKQAPPPSYQVAMSNSQPAVPTNTHEMLTGATMVVLPPPETDDVDNVAGHSSVPAEIAITSNSIDGIPPPAYNCVAVANNEIPNATSRINVEHNEAK